MNLIREEPERADWWIEQEARVLELPGRKQLDNPKVAQFSKRYSYEILRNWSNDPAQMTLFGPAEADIDCFCGD